VGMRVSHGCMRLYNEDVEEFARLITPGTRAHRDVPVKVGWKGGAMYVEVHEALEEKRAHHVPEEAVADRFHCHPVAPQPTDIDWLEARPPPCSVRVCRCAYRPETRLALIRSLPNHRGLRNSPAPVLRHSAAHEHRHQRSSPTWRLQCPCTAGSKVAPSEAHRRVEVSPGEDRELPSCSPISIFSAAG